MAQPLSAGDRRYVKEEGLMTLEEAVRKMTSFACRRLASTTGA